MPSAQATSGSAELEYALQNIKKESLDAVRARERNTFDRLAGPSAAGLVLFGAGPLGRTTLAGLRQIGIEPLSFADNNAKLWGEKIDELPVCAPIEAVKRYGSFASFVVTVYNGSAVRQQLLALGCRIVVPFTPLFWKYADVFIPESCVELPHRLRDGIDAIRQCHSILYDNSSRHELLGQLAWRYWMDSDALPVALDPHHTYFPFDLIAPMKDEVFVDCGSFDGCTIKNFATHWDNEFRHVFAFEPDSINRTALKTSVEHMGIADRVTIMPYAVANRSGPVSFTSTGSVTSHVGGISAVDCRRLDEIAWLIPPTYIKMDIEGAEVEALRGSCGLLKQHHPVLAVCTYHRGSHLWEIPNLIHAMAPEYHIFLRRYAEECWEGVCYAIPSNRLKRV